MSNQYFTTPSSSRGFNQLNPETQTPDSSQATASDIMVPGGQPSVPSQEPPQKKRKIFVPPRRPLKNDVDMGTLPDAPPAIVPATAPATAPETVQLFYQEVDEMPENLKFKENEAFEKYPGIVRNIPTDVLHKEYRGTDRPKKFEKVDGTKNFLHALKPAQFQFLDIMEGDYLAYRNIMHEKSKLVKVFFECDSQMPHLKVVISPPGGKKIVVRWFVNSLDDEYEQPLIMRIYADNVNKGTPEYDELRHQLDDNSELLEMALRKNLLEVQILLADEKTVQRGPNHQLPWCPPKFQGISEADLADIKSRYLTPDTDRPLSDIEGLIALFQVSKQIKIFRDIDSPAIPQVEYIRDFFMASAYCCLEYGNFWYYQMQKPEIDKGHPNFPINEILPARYMVKTWKTTALEEGEPPYCVEPWTWESYPNLKQFPDAISAAFIHRVGLFRERQKSELSLKAIMNSKNSEIQVRFRQIPDKSKLYFGFVKAPGIKATSVWENVKPPVETRVELKMAGGQNFNAVMQGRVVDHDPEYESDFVLVVKAKTFQADDNYHPVEMTTTDDPTTVTRSLHAINNIMQMTTAKRGKEPVRSGIDIPEFLFDAPPTRDPEHTGILANSLPPGRAEEIRNALSEQNLNRYQVDAIMCTVTTKTGGAIIIGPPGTGKTTALAYAIQVQVLLGRKCIVACPSNKAINTLMDKFLSIQPAEGGQKLRSVRFVGGFSNPSKEKTVSKDDIMLTPSDAATLEFSQNVYQASKLHHIKLWAAKDGHPMYDSARAFLEARTQLQKQGLPKDTRKRSKEELEALDITLTTYFFDKSVDVVFTACVSACHETLETYFSPEVAWIDEAGQAMACDICMTVSPFKNSVKSMILCGDPAQLTPVITAENSNEGASALRKSNLQIHADNPYCKHPLMRLKIQFRCHPSISRWPSHSIYGVKADGAVTPGLTDAPSTQITTKLQETVNQFLGLLGGARNSNNFRMAINCDALEFISSPYADSTSFCNDSEADAVVKMASALLKFKPIANPNRPDAEYDVVRPEDIYIISPYKGQVHLIRKKLDAYGEDSAEAKIQVFTTHNVQGDECRIGLISLVARSPAGPTKKIRFVSNKNGLTVLSTRSREVQFTFGNFGGWLKTINDNEWVWRMKSFLAMKEFVQDHHSRGDIVDIEDVRETLLATPQSLATLDKSRFYSRFPKGGSAQTRPTGQKGQKGWKKPSNRGGSKRKGQHD